MDIVIIILKTISTPRFRLRNTKKISLILKILLTELLLEKYSSLNK